MKPSTQSRRGIQNLYTPQPFFAMLVACAACAFLGSGCKENPEGPKRADNEAAHHPHYHPDVARSNISGSRPATDTAPRPPATQFADLFETGVIGSPVLFVNNQSIGIAEVLDPIIEDLRRQSRILNERDYTDAVLNSVRNQIDYQVSTILVYEQAKKSYSDKKTQEMIDRRVEQLVQDIVNEKYEGVKARYELHLKSLDYSPADARERLKRETIVREYLRERFKPMLREPSRHDLLRHYETHQADFTTVEKAELFLIEVPIARELDKPLADATPQEREAARASARNRIRRAREELDSGIDFGTVARGYSRGAMASQGGAWGEISRGSMQKRWAKAGEEVFSMTEGQIKEVETEDAVFLVRCGHKTPSHRATFEEAQKEIIDKMIDEQFNKYRNDYIRELITGATVSKRPEFSQAILAVVPKPRRNPSPGLLSPPGG